MSEALEGMIADALDGNESLGDDIVDSGTDNESAVEEDGGGEAAAEVTEESGEAVAAPEQAEQQQQQDEIDEIAAALGFKPGKTPRVGEVERKARKYIAEQQAKFQAEISAREERLQRLSQYEAPEFQEQQAALRLADENPEAFLSALAQADPRYAQLIRAAQQQAAPQQAAPEVDLNVEPDVMLPDGSLGWSPQAMQRMIAAQAQRVAQEAEARITQKFEQQFGPLVQEHRQAQMMRGAVSKAQTQLQQAQSWVGFEENRQDILQALQADRALSLEQAYIKVVGPKLAANKDTIRQQVLAEMQRKPSAAQAVVRAGGSPAKPKAPAGSLEAMIEQSLNEL